MKTVFLASLIVSCGLIGRVCYTHAVRSSSEPAQIAVVGGGPAGIISVAVLLELGVPAADIVWIDPEFSVGRLGKYYADIPANNKAKRFVEFIEMSKVFREFHSPAVDRLYTLNQEQEYPLRYIIEPLQDFTNYFIQHVRAVQGSLQALSYHDDVWHLDVNDNHVTALRVILALGSHPKELSYPLTAQQQVIPLDEALQPAVLQNMVHANDTVGVFGSAHSAVLIMKWLVESRVARIINFYRQPLWYLSAAEQAARACTLHGDPLSGVAASWAREVLDGNPPGNLIRVKSTDAAMRAWLPLCTKVIYAVGYERNEIPPITGASTDQYDPATGIIGPHLFGIGIGFPEFVEFEDGTCKYQIGLRDFMRFAQKMVPEWLHRDLPEACLYLEECMSITIL